MSVALKINEELNGIELYFNGKPSKEVRDQLKANRFSSFKTCWYAKQSPKTFKLAETLTNGTAPTAATEAPATTKQPKKAVTMSLWNATRWTDIEVNRNQENKLIAKEIKAHVKKRFPQVKFSVTSQGWNSVNVYIISSPYEKDSVYLNAIYKYCEQLYNIYTYVTHYDPYGDYGSSYNFYGSVSMYGYTQTEATEAIKADMADFDIQLAQFNKAEEERKEAEFAAYQKEQELREIEYKKQREEEKKQIETINNNVTVKELDENNLYYVIGSEFANLNKNNTLAQYKEEVSKGDFTLENVRITKEVHFNTQEALTYFSNLLLTDFGFLTNTGGSYTDDNRIQSITDYDNMTAEERKTVKWNLEGVAIYFNNQLQFIANAEGHFYARYVGLTDNATIEKVYTFAQIVDNESLTELKQQAEQLTDISTTVIDDLSILNTWQGESFPQYKEAVKSKLKRYNMKLNKSIIQQLEIEELKTAMYKLLTEVDGIQSQFESAELQQGDKLTLFHIGGMGGMIESRITYNSHEFTPYAQYNDNVKITFTPENKRKLHYNNFHNELLVFKGWHKLPTTVLNTVEQRGSFIVTSSKYSSCDHAMFDEILSHFEQQDITPIINTYKPMF